MANKNKKLVPRRQRYGWGRITQRKHDFLVDYWFTPERRETVICLTREGAEEVYDYFLSQSTGADVPIGQRTVGMYLRLYRDSLKGLEDESKEKYRFEMAPVVDLLGDKQVCDLSLQDILDIWSVMLEPEEDDGAAYSVDAVMRARRHLVKALEIAVDDEVIPSNVAARKSARPPQKRTKRKQEAWTAEETIKFLAAAQNHDFYSVYYLFLSTGLRRGELLALRWRNFDLKAGTIRVEETYTGYRFKPPKTPAAYRLFRISPAVVKHFEKYRNELALKGLDVDGNAFVFPGQDDRPLSPYKVLSELKNIARGAGLPERTCHELRHTFVYLSARAGISRFVLMKRLGHKNEHEMLKTYGHVFDEDEKGPALDVYELAYAGDQAISGNRVGVSVMIEKLLQAADAYPKDTRDVVVQQVYLTVNRLIADLESIEPARDVYELAA